jgi:predicted secreted protein
MNKWIVALGLSLLLSPAFAHEVQLEGIVNLQASASIEVETDTMQAVISVEAENFDPAVLAKNINKKMAWAIKTAKPFKHVKVKGGQYTSHQIYNKRIFKAWRGSQTITLKSKNIAQLGKLIGLLQKKLLIKSLRYHVSKEKAAAAKKDLIKQAIANFKQQAQTITQEFNKNRYVIHQINVNTNNHFRPVHYAKSRMLASTPMMAESAPANLQQNTSNIQVNINGSIRLVK